jgi:hypothetical protein
MFQKEPLNTAKNHFHSIVLYEQIVFYVYVAAAHQNSLLKLSIQIAKGYIHVLYTNVINNF